jgi:hypothetical protein
MVRIWEWSMWYCLYFSLNLDVDWFVSCLFSYLLQEHHVKTCHGSVSVVVYGDQEKPALITYPDVALNYMSCFQGLFLCPEAVSLLLHNFCIYHISPPGHEFGAAPVCSNDPSPSVEDLADQILEVLNFFSLEAVMCMGITAGAYILSLFAVCTHWGLLRIYL